MRLYLMKISFPKYLWFFCIWTVNILFHACDLLPAVALLVTLERFQKEFWSGPKTYLFCSFFLQQSILFFQKRGIRLLRGKKVTFFLKHQILMRHAVFIYENIFNQKLPKSILLKMDLNQIISYILLYLN